jgi:hypothetical protein
MISSRIRIINANKMMLTTTLGRKHHMLKCLKDDLKGNEERHMGDALLLL